MEQPQSLWDLRPFRHAYLNWFWASYTPVYLGVAQAAFAELRRVVHARKPEGYAQPLAFHPDVRRHIAEILRRLIDRCNSRLAGASPMQSRGVNGTKNDNLRARMVSDELDRLRQYSLGPSRAIEYDQNLDVLQRSSPLPDATLSNGSPSSSHLYRLPSRGLSLRRIRLSKSERATTVHASRQPPSQTFDTPVDRCANVRSSFNQHYGAPAAELHRDPTLHVHTSARRIGPGDADRYTTNRGAEATNREPDSPPNVRPQRMLGITLAYLYVEPHDTSGT